MKNINKTHCPNGHQYDEKNTIINKTNGGRQCRACGLLRAADWRSRSDHEAARVYAKEYRETHKEELKVKRDAYVQRNKEAIREKFKARYQADREKYRGLDRLSKYGITPEEYNDLLQAQGGVCAICAIPERRLGVDHNHETGAIRGLLCDMCNRGLGMFGDDQTRLARAARYVKATS